MRTLSLVALLVVSAPAWGQCPNGQCPVPQRTAFGPQYTLPQQSQRWAFPQSVGQYPAVQQCGPQGCYAAPLVGPPVVRQQPRAYPYPDVVVIDGVPTPVLVTGPANDDGYGDFPAPKVVGAAGERRVGFAVRVTVRTRLINELVERKGISRATARRLVDDNIDEPTLAAAATQAKTPDAFLRADVVRAIDWDRFLAFVKKIVELLLPILLTLI